MKVSDLCIMIEDSIRTGRYPLGDTQKRFANLVQVISRSEVDDLKSNVIKVEVRIGDLYVIGNYLPNIRHLPGVIEQDALDAFKMLCRRLETVA